ncbi:hypothetical protein THASP1DRAFT_28652 [Thamnocephalis sphaerospora]|uniref:Major facilitator superfamily domain-containing protein n=1 Tax=Thamnocephalis sphaerospora TaxID=78915 RepID=A0A4P9XVW1_9FUNG|nr:hypothetical protein THASP1DRAFT_28652 [Thamnocephalis sphaerospora]|eukprot:RKP09550.1 hypothetical protein THASP1DRAFT_28652 [Thamnocephalis sphaerospora]
MTSRPVSLMRVTRRRWRWIGVALTSVALASSYYAYDVPAALNRQLRAQLNVPPPQWQYWLAGAYAAYALPNTLMPYYAPHLMAWLGPRWTLGVLAVVACTGQLLVVAALLPDGLSQTLGPLALLLLGRFLLGFGVESLGVAQSALTCQWFLSSRRLGLALSLNVAMARIGAIVNDVASPAAVRWWQRSDRPLVAWLTRCLTSLGVPQGWLAATVMACGLAWLACCLSLAAVVAASLFDRWNERRRMHAARLMAAQTAATSGASASVSADQAASLVPATAAAGAAAAATVAASTLRRVPFQNARHQLSTRDVNTIRRSYLRVDALSRNSGLSRRRSRPPLQTHLRQRSATEGPTHTSSGAVWSSQAISVPNIASHELPHPSSMPGSLTGDYHSAPEPPNASENSIGLVPSIGRRLRVDSNATGDSRLLRRELAAHATDATKRHSVSSSHGSRGRCSHFESVDLSAGPPSIHVPVHNPWHFWLLCFSMAWFVRFLWRDDPICQSSDYLQTRWTTDAVHAGLLMAIPDLVSTLLVPFAHWYIGSGQKGGLYGIGIGIALILLGICYSVFAAIFWTALPHIMPNPDHHPAAYARMTSLLNLSQAAMPFLVARVIIADATFKSASWLFVIISLLATLTALVLTRIGALDPAYPLEDELEDDEYYEAGYYDFDDGSGYWSDEFSDCWESYDEHEGQESGRGLLTDDNLWDDDTPNRWSVFTPARTSRAHDAARGPQEQDALLSQSTAARDYATLGQ